MGTTCSDHDVDRNVSDEKLLELRVVALSDVSEAFASERAKLERTVADRQQESVKSRARTFLTHTLFVFADGCTLVALSLHTHARGAGKRSAGGRAYNAETKDCGTGGGDC